MFESNFAEYYDLEKHLFETVKPGYDQKKTISAEDFFALSSGKQIALNLKSLKSY